MRKASKRTEGKGKAIAERLNEKGVVCVSAKWKKWAKRWLNKKGRRK